MAKPIRLVCLDLGGVLVRVRRDWREACHAAALDLSAAEVTEDFGARLIEVGREHESGMIDEVEFERRAAEVTRLARGHVVAACEAWLNGAYPGAHDFVGRLAADSHVRSACLSNTNPRHFRMLNSPGPNDLGLGRLTFRFLSHEIGHMKPSPAIYHHVEVAAGVEPDGILFFDDNADNVAAARGCGWNAERVDPLGDPPAEVAMHLARFGIYV